MPRQRSQRIIDNNRKVREKAKADELRLAEEEKAAEARRLAAAEKAAERRLIAEKKAAEKKAAEKKPKKKSKRRRKGKGQRSCSPAQSDPLSTKAARNDDTLSMMNELRQIRTAFKVNNEEHQLQMQQLQRRQELAAAEQRSCQGGVLDAGAVQLALQLQTPLLRTLTHSINMQASSSSRHTTVHVTDVVASEEEQEYDKILGTFSSNHNLFGLRWVDFKRLSENELQEMFTYVTSFAHRRALQRLHSSD